MVLHRPIETTAFIGQLKLIKNHMSDNATYQDLMVSSDDNFREQPTTSLPSAIALDSTCNLVLR